MILQIGELPLPGEPENGYLVLDCFEARTPEEMAEGLSTTPVLPPGTGMLFFFDGEDKRTFWMPEQMAFPIDIIFIGGNKRVTGVVSNCQPGDPRKFKATAEWVLEVNAGVAQQAGIQKGTEVLFEDEGESEGMT